MTRLGELDLTDRLMPTVPRIVTQLGVGLLCAVIIGLIRYLFDLVAPGAAPFALVYPAIIVATLFARWPAGLATAVISIAYAWLFVFPLGVAALDPRAWLSIVVVSIAAVLTIVIAELFRRSVRGAVDERNRQIADRDLFLAEFDHRVKNNFAIVASLLDLQRRRTDDAATIEALTTAQMRVDSIARAHRHLYRDAASPGVVEMRDYLHDLCSALAEALFLRGGITLDCSSDAAQMPRDRAVSIGLIVNELVTNAAKHAFAGRDRGRIEVRFTAPPEGGTTVIVADDGIGLPEQATKPGPDNGLGSRLIEAFARQAGGTISTDSDRTGTRVTLTLSDFEPA